jgi:hypothetical protein
VKAMSKACQSFEIHHAIEISRSGNGIRLWIFYNEKAPAKEARLLGFGLLDKAMKFYPNLSFDSYDRLFPYQDILPDVGFGKLIGYSAATTSSATPPYSIELSAFNHKSKTAFNVHSSVKLKSIKSVH